MADPLYVFAYDIERDRARVRVADLLGDSLARVQDSVFEGRLTHKEAISLARQAAVHLGPRDSLRVYCIPPDGLARCHGFGPPPLPEQDDFWIA
jgi:CRISPR-associated protein Cas2